MPDGRASYDRVGPSQEDMLAELMAAAKRNGVEGDLPMLQNMMKQESQFDPNARSSAGAYGPMQLTRIAAKDVGVDRFDWRQNIEGGVRYFAKMKQKYGNAEDAARAYNAGPGHFDRSKANPVTGYGGFPETNHYVDIVSRPAPAQGGGSLAVMTSPEAPTSTMSGSVPTGQDLFAPGSAAANVNWLLHPSNWGPPAALKSTLPPEFRPAPRGRF